VGKQARTAAAVALATSDEPLTASAAGLPAIVPLDTLVGTPARNPWNTPLETRVAPGADDRPFATDMLTPPAVVPHHGTLLKVAKDGSATEILATGFRAANGVCVEPDGTVHAAH
jgi:sugar lactone lactonase YvrE